jgi:hypothetical protein
VAAGAPWLLPIVRPRRRVSMGQADVSADVSADLDAQASAYADLPGDNPNDAAFKKAVRDTVSAGVEAVNKSAAERRRATEAAFHAAMTAIALAVPGLGTAFAAILETFYALAPHAGAGPGTCPPDGGPVLPGDPNFYTWDGPWGPGAYTEAPAGTFEAAAQTILRANFEAILNACGNPTPSMYAMLAQTVAEWNKRHAPTSSHVVTRGWKWIPSRGGGAHIVADGQPDPIWLALNAKMDPKRNGAVSFVVNDGPIVVQAQGLLAAIRRARLAQAQKELEQSAGYQEGLRYVQQIRAGKKPVVTAGAWGGLSATWIAVGVALLGAIAGAGYWLVRRTRLAR